MCFEPGSFREKAPSNCVCSYVCNYESTSVYTHTCGSALRTWNMWLRRLPKGKSARWVFLALHTEERRLPESHLLPSRMTFLLWGQSFVELRKSADWESTAALSLPYSVGFGFMERWGRTTKSLLNQKQDFFQRKKKKKSPWGTQSLTALAVTTARDPTSGIVANWVASKLPFL